MITINNSVEAICAIIDASNGKGQGAIAQYSAYSVMKVEADVLVVSREVARMVQFATPRQTRNYGVLFDMFNLSGVAAYAAEYGQDEAEAVARAKKNGHELFWLNKIGACITSHERVHEYHLQVLPGQKIMFDGVLMEVQPEGNNNLKLEAI